MENNLANFTDILGDEIPNSQPLSLPSVSSSNSQTRTDIGDTTVRPSKHTGQYGNFRSIEEIDPKYRDIFTYPYFNLVQSSVIEDALYSDKSMVVCAPTGSGKTVIFEMAIVQLLMHLEDTKYNDDFKIIYMAPVKALCTERLTEWYPKLTKHGLLCIEVTGDTDVDFNQLQPYRVIITTPEKWDMLTRRWRDHRGLVEVIKLFLIDEVHILNDEVRGPVLEAVVSRMKTIESSTQSDYRIEQLRKQYQNSQELSGPVKNDHPPPNIRFVAVSATVSNPEDVAKWLGTTDKPAVYKKFGDECRPVKINRVVEGYPCPEGTSIFKFDIILNYKLWPIIQKYHNGKPTLIFCNTRKSVTLTAETLSKELTISFTPEQKSKLTALASTIKNKKLQALIMAGVGCHHAGLLYEERLNIERAFRNRDLPILITTTTLAMGVNLPAHLVIIKNTQQYVNGAYQEYSISTVLQMVGRAGRPQYDTEATAVIMTRLADKQRYQALVYGSEPLQSYLHKRLAENLNSEAALGTVNDVAQCVQWLRSTFLYVRAARDPRRYLKLPSNAQSELILEKIEELCVRAMNGLATAGLITMDEASCIESTEAGRLMSLFYLDLETMKHIMKIEGTETLERMLWIVCESHELSEMHLRVDERRSLNALNRNNAAATIRFPLKGKINTRQMKVNCLIQATLGCLNIPDPSLNQEAMKIMRIADRICKCLVAYVTRPDLISQQPKHYSAVLNAVLLTKCIAAHLWENSPYVSRQLKGIGPTFSTLLATAGKINFLLLEESHPRDLERIMNKGPPAGNVLRKQISLLPKYQITMTPVNERTVSIRIILINHNCLSDNMEQLTAGEAHKCYLIAGDSENYLLLFTHFKDKDLIGLYDGCITHNITRKHNFEHKVMVHCISSSYVGIDAHCEYVFKGLDGIQYIQTNTSQSNDEITLKKTTKRQTCITDVFKERKRKNNDVEITQSKEKKRRENAFTEKIRILKESFEKVSRELKEDFKKSVETSQYKNKHSEENITLNNKSKCNIVRNGNENIPITDYDLQNTSDDHLLPNIDENGFENMDDLNINNILNEIENEISKAPKLKISQKSSTSHKQAKFIPSNVKNMNVPICTSLNLDKQSYPMRKRKKINNNFKNLLDKSLSDEENINNNTQTTGFSDAIKSHINKYLETQIITNGGDNAITKLISDEILKPEILDEETEEVINLPFVNIREETWSNTDEKYSKNKSIKDGYIDNKTNNFTDKRAKKSNGDINLVQSEETLVLENINTNEINNRNLLKMMENANSYEETQYTNNDKYIDLTGSSPVGLPNKSKRKPDNSLSHTWIDRINETIKEGHIYNETNNSADKRAKEFNDDMDFFHSQETIVLENINPRQINRKKEHQIIQNIDSNEETQYTNNDKYIYLPGSPLIGVPSISKRKPDNSLSHTSINLIDKTIKDGDIYNKTNNFADERAKESNGDMDFVKCQETIVLEKMNPGQTNNENFLQTMENTDSNENTLHKNNDEYIDLNESQQIGLPILSKTKRDNSLLSHMWMIDHINIDKNIDTMNNSNKKTNSEKKSETFVAVLRESQSSFNNYKICNALNALQYLEINETLNINSRTSNTKNNVTTAPTEVVEVDNMSKRNSYTKKYSYTAAKVDVQTHNTPEYQVRIIRRLKLDLDITETITSNNINQRNIQNDDTEPTSENEIRNSITAYKSPNNNKTRVDDVFKQIEETEKDNSNTMVTDEHIRIQDTKSANTVGSILNKYSKILRKNNSSSKEKSVDENQFHRSNNEVVKKTERKNRPFKITDIHKIAVELPDTVIVLPNKIESEKSEVKVIETMNDVSQPNNLQIGEIIEDKILSSVPIRDDISCDCNFDQSMFDPKMVLEYLNKDDSEIIPPPPQFSDVNYSPTHSIENYSDSELLAEVGETFNVDDMCNITQEGYADDKFQDENIFHSNLSPSETRFIPQEMILDQAISKNPSVLTHNSFFDYRRNISIDKGSNARSKLNEFKFKRKSKLKM